MTLWTAALDLFFPPKCPYCHKVLDDPRAPVCPGCQVRLPWLTGRAGEKRVDFTDGCFSPLAYGDRVREAVHRYKFQRVRACAVPFGAVMAQCLADRLPQGADLITWCPLHKKRLRERGFDQARLLAREVGRRLDIPVRGTLAKDRNTRPQSELEEGERPPGQRPGGVFSVARDGPDGKAGGAGGRRGDQRLHPVRVRPAAAPGGGGGGLRPHPGPGPGKWGRGRGFFPENCKKK